MFKGMHTRRLRIDKASDIEWSEPSLNRDRGERGAQLEARHCVETAQRSWALSVPLDALTMDSCPISQRPSLVRSAVPYCRYGSVMHDLQSHSRAALANDGSRTRVQPYSTAEQPCGRIEAGLSTSACLLRADSRLCNDLST